MLLRARNNRTNYPSAQAIANSLLEHDGPLENRRATPKGKVNSTLLKEAIAIAEGRGMTPGWKVWHFDQVDDKWLYDEDVVDAITTVLHQRGIIPGELDPKSLKAEFDFSPLTSLKANDMETPVTVKVGSRSMPVPVSGLFALNFRSCTHKVVTYYVEKICGEEIASMVRPYHMQFSSRNTLKEESLVGEVIGKQLTKILENRDPKDLFTLALGVTIPELSAPFIEKIGAARILITPSTIFCFYSALDAVRLGLSYLGHETFAKELKDYHREKASNGTWKVDSPGFRRLLVRYLSALKKEHYGGDLVEMVRNFTPTKAPSLTLEDILADPITGEPRKVEISVASMMGTMDNARWAIVGTYLEETGELALKAKLRPYHLVGAVRTSSEIAYASRKEFLLRHMARLLSAPPYNGDIKHFAKSVTASDLVSPLTETFDNRAFEISTKTLYDYYGQSPRKMVRAYLTLTNQQDILEELRDNPRQSRKAFRGRTSKEEIEILFGAIDSLRSQRVAVVSYQAMRKPYLKDGEKISTALCWRRWAKRVQSSLERKDPLAELIRIYKESRGLPEGSIAFERGRGYRTANSRAS